MFDLLRVKMALGNAGDDTPVTLRGGDLKALIDHYEETEDYDEVLGDLGLTQQKLEEAEKAFDDLQGDLEKAIAERDAAQEERAELERALAGAMAA